MCAALDQAGTKMLFKRADLPRHRRLRNATLLRHGRERADFGDAEKCAERSDEIHGSYPKYQTLSGDRGFAAVQPTLFSSATKASDPADPYNAI